MGAESTRAELIRGWTRRPAHHPQMVVVGVVASASASRSGWPSTGSRPAAPKQAKQDRHALGRPDHLLGPDLRPRGDRRPVLGAASSGCGPGQEHLDGPPIHGNTRLEVVWTAIPALMLVVAVHLRLPRPARHREGAGQPATSATIDVTASSSPGPSTTPSRRQAVRPRRSSTCPRAVGQVRRHAKDVLHDFWVPAFRMKIDAVPGITTHYRVTPTKLGTYPVVCAELCGLGHAFMRRRRTC